LGLAPDQTSILISSVHVSGILSRGHVDFAPRSELEFQLLKYPLDRHNIQRVSAERVVSGRIVAIYQFLRDSSKAVNQMGKWSGRGNKKPPEDR